MQINTFTYLLLVTIVQVGCTVLATEGSTGHLVRVHHQQGESSHTACTFIVIKSLWIPLVAATD